MADKARHAFGSESKISEALAAGKIDAYDILFLDEKKVGWITKDGEVVIAEQDLSGLEAAIAEKANAEDVVALENQIATKASIEEISALESELATKATIEEVDAKIETVVNTEIETVVKKEVETKIEEKIKEIETAYEVVEF